MKALRRALCGTTLALCGMGAAHAGMTINGTRVIYPAEQSKVTLSMVNNGDAPVLMQAWVDDGDAQSDPAATKAPFMVMPAMARVDPGKGQTLRILATGADFPQDRETVYWLNIFEIPTKPKAGAGGSENYMQMSSRTRLKLFYRPKGLTGTPFTAADQLEWRIVQKGTGYAAECTNRTPYNISFSDLTFKGSVQQRALTKGGMCPAKGKDVFPVAGTPDASNKIVLTVVNDFGGFNEHEVGYSR